VLQQHQPEERRVEAQTACEAVEQHTRHVAGQRVTEVEAAAGEREVHVEMRGVAIFSRFALARFPICVMKSDPAGARLCASASSHVNHR
jgi:hypothetical protein